MKEVAIYILIEHIIPIPIAVEGFCPIIINPAISKQNEQIYVNLYDEINSALRENKCDRFEESQQKAAVYKSMAEEISNLYPCGRLADFKYYNMDQALARAMSMADKIRI